MNTKNRIIVALVLLILLLGSLYLFLPEDISSNNSSIVDQEFSSYRPIPIFSSSELQYLIFSHTILDYDAFSTTLYFTRMYSDGSWSIPKKLFEEISPGFFSNGKLLYTQVLSTGIRLYFFNRGYEGKQGLYSQEYISNNDEWLSPEPLFVLPDIHSYLNLTYNPTDYDDLNQPSTNRLNINAYAFKLFDNGSYALSWKFLQSDGATFSKLQGKTLISVFNPDNIIKQTISIAVPSDIGLFGFEDGILVEMEGELVMYSDEYDGYSIYSKNNFSSILPTPNSDSSEYINIPINDDFLIVLNSTLGVVKFKILDLTNQSNYSEFIDLPFNSIEHSKVDYRITSKDRIPTKLQIVYYDEEQFNLWEFSNQTWISIATYKYQTSFDFYSGSPYGIQFLQYDDSWKIFWGEGSDYKDGEIYSLVFNGKEWETPVQISFSSQFTGDYQGGAAFFPGFNLNFLLITGLLIIGIIVYVKRNPKSQQFRDNELYPEK